MTNLLGTICTKFYHDRSGFVDSYQQTFWCVFSFHIVHARTCRNIGLVDFTEQQ